MPDMLKTREEFMSMAVGAGELNLLNAVEKPLNAYGPCWCLSGKKWKFCHKDREKQQPVPYGKAHAELLKHYSTGPCQHPDASSATCSSPSSIKSHTIQRRGGLAAIAEDGHVCSTKKAFSNLEKRGGQVDLEKVGVGLASTFPGFCNHHDTELFRPVEQKGSKLDAYNAFLLSLRAVTYEIATKDAQRRSNEASKSYLDNGRPFHMQAMLQNFLHFQQIGIDLGIKDGIALRAQYDEAFRSNDLSEFSFCGIEFDRILPFAAAGAFMPEYDFAGTKLQEIVENQPASHIALNITQLGDNTCVVFGWFGGDCAAAGLVESFMAIPDDEKADALLVLAMEHLENFFCTPSWWNALAPLPAAKLHKKIAGVLAPI